MLWLSLLRRLSRVQGGSQPQNGNFFTGSKDIVYPGGFEPKVERVYNSKTSFKGIFGYGWGNEYEVFLTVEADGSVVVREYGGGAENRFSPVRSSPQELDAAVAMISDAAKKAGSSARADQKRAVQEKAENRCFLPQHRVGKIPRSRQSRRHASSPRARSSFQPFQLPIHHQDGRGYVRVFDNGRVEQFNEEGKLARIADKNHNFIDLTYGKDGHLDQAGRQFQPQDVLHLQRSRLPREDSKAKTAKKATYKYNNLGELVWAQGRRRQRLYL